MERVQEESDFWIRRCGHHEATFQAPSGPCIVGTSIGHPKGRRPRTRSHGENTPMSHGNDKSLQKQTNHVQSTACGWRRQDWPRTGRREQSADLVATLFPSVAHPSDLTNYPVNHGVKTILVGGTITVREDGVYPKGRFCRGHATGRRLPRNRAKHHGKNVSRLRIRQEIAA